MLLRDKDPVQRGRFAGARSRLSGRCGRLDDVAALRNLQGHPRILLHEQDGDAPPVQTAMISKICSTMTGARPIDGSSSSISFGSIISPRAIVSICCSPPESVPACCRSRSRRRGKRSSEASSSSCVRALLRLRYAPIRRFSNTVFSAKMPRPSGTCAMPRAAISCRGQMRDVLAVKCDLRLRPRASSALRWP